MGANEVEAVQVPVPPGLLDRGAALWVGETTGWKRDVARETVLLEACRIADRLDILDAALHGQVDLFKLALDDSVVVVRMDAVAVESRNLSVALGRMLSSARRLGERLPKVLTAEEVRLSRRDELAKRRSGRLAAAAGGE